LIEGNPITQQHEILSQSRPTKESKLSDGENLSLYLTWAWIGTSTWHQDRWTDRQANRIIIIANTRSQHLGRCCRA